MQFLKAISPRANLRQLRSDGKSATINRLMVSRHVADLRLIFSFALLIVVASISVAVWFGYEHELILNKSGGKTSDPLFAALMDCGAFIGAVGAIGCGVLAWTYQTGSGRLGVVDLFACEITTLCRAAVVVDVVQRYIGMARLLPNSPPHFSSEEDYFPVFDKTTKDLQLLEEEVVKQVTAFYTYMKMMRDTLRKLADVNLNEGHAAKAWQGTVSSMIYMLFLGLESARKAIDQLVEFQPTRAEEKIVILLSELDAYAYLRSTVTDRLLSRRLKARETTYLGEVGELVKAVSRGQGNKWDVARDLLPELVERFHRIFPKREYPLPRVDGSSGSVAVVIEASIA